MKSETVKCSVCGKDFVRVYGAEKRCPVCRKLPYYTKKNVMHTVKCSVCGKEFKTTLYNKLYCSAACRYKYHYGCEKYREDKVCPVCGKTFSTNRKWQKFCSKECRPGGKNV